MGVALFFNNRLDLMASHRRSIMFLASLFFIIPGILYLVFAFREPPAGIAHFFCIPAFFVFFPEHSRVKLGRITAGVLLTGSGTFWLLWDLYHRLFGWR